MTAADKMIKARAALVLDQPFFGSLALRLKMKETDDPSIDTMATNGEDIFYSAKWVDGLNMQELKGVLCHEVMHLANAHHCRRGNRDSKRWNLAADAAINPLIEAAGMTLPKGGVSIPSFNNMEAEAIYAKLPPDPPEEQGGGKGKGNDPGGCGGVMDLPGKDGGKASGIEKEQAAQDWKVATQQAAQAAKMAGKLPGALSRLIEELLEPVVDWREALRQFIDRTARNDYTWSRPNPRYFSRGFCLPSLYNQELPPIVIAVDTSGSIGGNDLQQFASEIDDILNQYPTTLTVIYCDAEVRHVETFEAEDRPIRLDAKGGGGTRFSPVWEWLEKNADETPACAVYLTDLCCSDYGDDPGFPVLWVNTGGYKAEAPPFGEVVRLRAGV